jgi:ribosomal protein S18 acetylase RimI-like enzyme
MMGETFRTRYAKIEDAENLLGFAARAFRNTYIGEVNLQDLESHIASEFSLSQIRDLINDQEILTILLLEDAKLIAYMTLKMNDPDPSVLGLKPIQLGSIYVDNEIIGRGLGSTLMKKAFSEAKERGYKTIWVSAWDRNASALKFYQKWGFNSVGTIKFPFGSEIHSDTVLSRPIEDSVE